jgi:hypothetical protein
VIGTSVPVSLISPRLFLSVSVLATPVCGNACATGRFLPARRSKEPQSVGDDGPAERRLVVLLSLSCETPCELLERRDRAPAGLLKFDRKLPENTLPPLLVIAFTTPPEKRPYSAGMPDVSVCTS